MASASLDASVAPELFPARVASPRKPLLAPPLAALANNAPVPVSSSAGQAPSCATATTRASAPLCGSVVPSQAALFDALLCEEVPPCELPGALRGGKAGGGALAAALAGA
jgi:hypothetical protein